MWQLEYRGGRGLGFDQRSDHCGNVPAFGLNLPNESIVLGKDKELVNAVVYLRVARRASPMAVHAEYEATFKKPVVLVQYNIHIDLLNLNRLVPANGRITANVDKTSTMPAPVVSIVQPWMRAYLVALDHPYAAVTGQDGRFEIKNVPAGEHEFQFWHDTGYLKGGRMKTGATDQRGRIKLNIQSGETLDLGDVKVRI
jgi:hypothetical protein